MDQSYTVKQKFVFLVKYKMVKLLMQECVSKDLKVGGLQNL